jgi:phosphatidylglycerophosphatase A
MRKINFFKNNKYFKKLIIIISTLGPIGFIKFFPGTYSSILGIIFWILILENKNLITKIIFVFVSLLISIIICDQSSKIFNIKDPSYIVLDEFTCSSIIFINFSLNKMQIYGAYKVFLIGFIIFRMLDISKIFIINNSQNFNGGIGIILDDLISSLFTSLILSILF